MAAKRILLLKDGLNDVEPTLTTLEKGYLANDIIIIRDGHKALGIPYSRRISLFYGLTNETLSETIGQ